MTDLISEALKIAKKAHTGQVDKGGNDYLLHPITVALHCDNEKEKIVALLHDVIEDSDTSLEELSMFDQEIVDAVIAITRNEGQKREEYIEQVSSNEIARKVKIQDLINNMDLSRIKNVTQRDLDRIERYKRELKYLKSLD